MGDGSHAEAVVVATGGGTGAAARVQTTVTRPANITAYTAGDVVGGAITFAAIGTAGGIVAIKGVELRIDIAAIPAGMAALRLYLYGATPPSALADNAAFDLPAGDRAAFLGFIDLAAPVDLGATLLSQADNLTKLVKLGAAETALYAYLVTVGGFTPAAVSEVYAITISAQAL